MGSIWDEMAAAWDGDRRWVWDSSRPVGEWLVEALDPREGETIDPAGLDRYLRPRLASFMRPRYIEVRQDFPRTPTQRVQKFKLREEGVTPGTWDRRARRAE